MNKNKIAANFNRAAHIYDQHAILQQGLGNHLLERIIEQKINPTKILDLGCGTGFFTNKLSERFLNAEILGVDIADKMIEFAQNKYPLRFMCADIDNLPLMKHDLIFSNCVLQWMPNLRATFKKIKKMLAKNGRLFFSTFINGTLQELQEALGDRCINNFVTFTEIENILQQEQYQDVSLKFHTINFQFDDLIEVMRYLRNIGANYSLNYSASLLNAKKIVRAAKFYQNRFNVTFNVVYGCVRG